MKNLPLRIFLLLCILCLFPHISLAEKKAADFVSDGQKIDLSQNKYTLLFQELTKDNTYTQSELDTLFTGVQIKKRVLVLMDTQWEAKPYYEYRPRFITKSVIKKAKKKLKKHKKILDRIEQELGVNREVIIAIWGIESRFGKNSGGFNVFRTLNTLFDAYPRRSDFFREQLIAFMILCKENNYNPLSIEGSYAGAFGQTQFIPSSFREYALSFDGDSRRDVFGSIHDILASIANYLRHFHWTLDAPIYADIGQELKGTEVLKANSKGRKGLVDYKIVQQEQSISLPVPPENRQLTIVGLEIAPKKGGGKRYIAGYPNFQAITEWNHSNRYAMAVSELAEAIR
ncbi:MAG TPA: lytic murein transglycosylase [Desulfobacterales bacterium]|nr:lytic murein transglycosylase [Desulfobacterales bacterium]